MSSTGVADSQEMATTSSSTTSSNFTVADLEAAVSDTDFRRVRQILNSGMVQPTLSYLKSALDIDEDLFGMLLTASNISLSEKDHFLSEIVASENRRPHVDRVASLLLIAGANPDAGHCLNMACKNLNHSTIKLLLKMGADPNLPDDTGKCPLHVANSFMDIDLYERLLTGFNVNSVDQSGFTPLHYACLMGNSERVEMLLRNGANRQAPGAVPMFQIYQHFNGYGQAPCSAETMINQFGFDPMQSNEEGETALFFLTGSHLPEFRLANHAEFLVNAMQQVVQAAPGTLQARNKSGQTVLHHILQQEYLSLEMVRFLVSRDPELLLSQDSANRTPLDIAMSKQAESSNNNIAALLFAPHLRERDHTAAIQAMVEARPDLLEQRDTQGRTPLHRAAMTNNQTALEQLLELCTSIEELDQGQCLCLQDNEGRTALHLAVLNGWQDALEPLVGSGPDVHVRDNQGMIPVHLLGSSYFLSPDYSVLRRVARLTQFSDLNAQDNQGRTALHQVVAFGCSTVAHILLLRDADAEILDHQGRLPLHLVGLSPDHCLEAKTVDFLLGNCSVDTKDNHGNLPFFQAATNEHVEAVFLMLRECASRGLFDGKEGARTAKKRRAPSSQLGSCKTQKRS